jgi:hypothetical protein
LVVSKMAFIFHIRNPLTNSLHHVSRWLSHHQPDPLKSPSFIIITAIIKSSFYLTILPCFKTTAPSTNEPTFTRTRMVRMKRRSWQLAVSIGMWGPHLGPPNHRDHRDH